jgi:hypothetical protein
MKVIIGPADLNFEIWFGKEKLSKDSAIKVEWERTSPPHAEEGVEDEFLFDDTVVSKSHRLVFRDIAQNSVARLSNISLVRSRVNLLDRVVSNRDN